MSFAAVGLHQPKSRINVGAALRAVGCYGASFLATTGYRYRKSPTDTQREVRRTPLIQVNDLHEVIPYDCVPVAVEIAENSQLLPNYKHPKRAFYIFGPEDGGVPTEIQRWCRDIITIPTDYCMNLAATVNVVLYDRLAKSWEGWKDD